MNHQWTHTGFANFEGLPVVECARCGMRTVYPKQGCCNPTKKTKVVIINRIRYGKAIFKLHKPEHTAGD
jgi:uncharacterized OB-fold protein